MNLRLNKDYSCLRTFDTTQINCFYRFLKFYSHKFYRLPYFTMAKLVLLDIEDYPI